MSTTQTSRPRPPGMGVRRPADARTLMTVGAAAALTDLAVRSGVVGRGGTLLVVVVAAALVGSGRVPGLQASGVVAAAVPFGVCLSLRMSPWLLPLDILAVGGLLVLGASLAGGGSLFDLPFPSLAARGVHALAHGLAAPAFVAGPIEGRRLAALLRGFALALPLLVVLGLLMASADAVFAGFFRWSSPETVISHGVLFGVGAWGMAGLLRLASAEPAPPPPRLPYRLGHVEATVVLGSLLGLFAAFAAAQVVAISGGGRHVLQTAGLTYAEYARTGFFQLLAVAGITVVTLIGLRASTELSDGAHRRRFTVLAVTAIALTLVIVVVALRRLDLYQQAYGLTMLRLCSSVAAVWIGLVVVLTGCALVGLGASRAWLPGAAIATALVLLLGLNVVNPEAVVVGHNVDRAARTQKIDPGYLAGLSDDAVPALVGALPRLREPARGQVLAAVCAGSDAPSTGWAAANTSRRRAAEARRRVCAPAVRR